ncbi:MAG: hypothetical protein WB780_04780 [Candidatus Acidiferrales bacterium]
MIHGVLVYNGGQRRGRCGILMAYDIYNQPSGRSRRWVRRKGREASVPVWARWLILILCAVTVAVIGWDRVPRLMQGARKSPVTEASTAAVRLAPVDWQADVGHSLEDAVRWASGGDITQAEVAVDRAAAFVNVARLRSRDAKPEFFETAIGQLDLIVASHPENERLSEHAGLMEIELAELRSSMETAPAQTGTTNRVAMYAPRAINRDATLDPRTLGGNVLDATAMPSSAEILEPPSSRLFVDSVRVENVTLEGAVQTLDGMHWKNVTFIGTRLRYEGGEVDLENVHFVRCTFGLTTDERGERIATAVALGRTSLVIE